MSETPFHAGVRRVGFKSGHLRTHCYVLGDRLDLQYNVM